MIVKVKTTVNQILEINYLQYGMLKKILNTQFKNNGGRLLKMKFVEDHYYISINTANKDYAVFLVILERYLELFELTVIDKAIKN